MTSRWKLCNDRDSLISLEYIIIYVNHIPRMLSTSITKKTQNIRCNPALVYQNGYTILEKNIFSKKEQRAIGKLTKKYVFFFVIYILYLFVFSSLSCFAFTWNEKMFIKWSKFNIDFFLWNTYYHNMYIIIDRYPLSIYEM